MKKLLALLATLAMVMGVSTFFTASMSSAHANAVTGLPVCNSQTGKFDITWTIANDYDLTETATTRLGVVNIDKHGSKQQSESGVNAGTYSLTAAGEWSDGYKQSDSGSVTAGGTCNTPQPNDAIEHRDITNPPNCDTHQVVTEHQSRHIPYVLVNGEWVPGTPGDWTTDSTSSRITTHEECSTGTQPPADTQTRDVVDSPNCEVYTVTTEHQSRSRTYSFNDASWSWVPGEWSAWHTDSSDTRDATLEECPAPTQPPAIVQTSDRSKYECGDDFTTVTTTTVTTPYVLDVPTRTWVLGTPVTSTADHKVSVDKVACPTTTVIKHTAKTIVTGSLPGTGGPSLLIGLAAFAAIGAGAATLRLSRKS